MVSILKYTNYYINQLMDTEITVTLLYNGNSATIPKPKSFEQLINAFIFHFEISYQSSVSIVYHQSEQKEIKLHSEEAYDDFSIFLYQKDISAIDLNFDKSSRENQSEKMNLSKTEEIAQRFYFMKTKDKVLHFLKLNMIFQRHLVCIINQKYRLVVSSCFKMIKTYTFELKEKEDLSIDNDTNTNSFGESFLCIENFNLSFEYKGEMLNESVLTNDVSMIQSKDGQSFIDEDYDYVFLQELIILLNEKKIIKRTHQFPITSSFNIMNPFSEIETEPQYETEVEYLFNLLKKQQSILLSMYPSLPKATLLLYIDSSKVNLHLNAINSNVNIRLRNDSNETSSPIDVSKYILLTYLNILVNNENNKCLIEIKLPRLHFGDLLCLVFMISNL